jgi:hypothetical protein
MQSHSPLAATQPPPRCAPDGCPVVIGWELAVSLWERHTPGPLATCAFCRADMTCPSWRFAHLFLSEAVARTTALDETTRELPALRQPPLPRRQPGAQLATEERYDGWFTR